MPFEAHTAPLQYAGVRAFASAFFQRCKLFVGACYSVRYADQRKSTYEGIHADKYVEWFLPISEQLLRVLKPTGTFVLNIKEKVVEGERSTYVMELILAMRKQGWLWTEEFIWDKKNLIQENGLIIFVTLGKDFYNSTKTNTSTCIKRK